MAMDALMIGGEAVMRQGEALGATTTAPCCCGGTDPCCIVQPVVGCLPGECNCGKQFRLTWHAAGFTKFTNNPSGQTFTRNLIADMVAVYESHDIGGGNCNSVCSPTTAGSYQITGSQPFSGTFGCTQAQLNSVALFGVGGVVLMCAFREYASHDLADRLFGTGANGVPWYASFNNRVMHPSQPLELQSPAFLPFQGLGCSGAFNASYQNENWTVSWGSTNSCLSGSTTYTLHESIGTTNPDFWDVQINTAWSIEVLTTCSPQRPTGQILNAVVPIGPGGLL